MVDEVWLPVSGYEGNYEVSNLGKVRSLDRILSNKRHQTRAKGRVLKHSFDSWGYPHIGLCRDYGKKFTFKIHRLVAIAFTPNPENKPCVNHLDGNKTNNTAANLEWATSKENHDHAVATGLKRNPVGDNGRARLTPELIQQAKTLRALGNTYASIGRELGVSENHARMVVIGRRWKHLN
jgi:NUMOD4 motif/HNH endonuclease